MTNEASPRWLNVILGGWLLLSAFLWLHSFEQSRNSMIVGGACAVMAAIALRAPDLRFVNLGIAFWLFVSVWVLPIHHDATFWNNLIVSVLMSAAALLPDRTLRNTARG
jgi:hypothetical protein